MLTICSNKFISFEFVYYVLPGALYKLQLKFFYTLNSEWVKENYKELKILKLKKIIKKTYRKLYWRLSVFMCLSIVINVVFWQNCHRLVGEKFNLIEHWI